MAKTAQARMAMYNLNLLSNDNIPEDGEEREDGWEGRCSIDDEKWNVVDFEAIRQISHSSPPVVCMSDDYDLVPSINELRRQLVDVRFDSSGLGKEEIADHRNVVRHGGQTKMPLASRQIHRCYVKGEDPLLSSNRSVSRCCCRCHYFVLQRGSRDEAENDKAAQKCRPP
jgi:hypothetical protein